MDIILKCSRVLGFLLTLLGLGNLWIYPLRAQDHFAEAKLQAVQEYQSQAVRLYPELGKAGSPMNKCFLRAYADASKANDPIVNQVDWPLIIAKYAAESVNTTKVGSDSSTEAGILVWLQKAREENTKRIQERQTAQAKEAERRQMQAELERNSVVLRGTVSQVVDDGIIMDANILVGYYSETGRDAPMIVRDLDGSIDPQKSGFTPRYSTERLFLSGHPQKENLVDGAEIAVVAVPNGTYHYTSTSGAARTIKSWKVLKAVDVGR